MATWKDLYKMLIEDGLSPEETYRRLGVKPSRLRKMLASKRFGVRIRAVESLAEVQRRQGIRSGAAVAVRKLTELVGHEKPEVTCRAGTAMLAADRHLRESERPEIRPSFFADLPPRPWIPREPTWPRGGPPREGSHVRPARQRPAGAAETPAQAARAEGMPGSQPSSPLKDPGERGMGVSPMSEVVDSRESLVTGGTPVPHFQRAAGPTGGSPGQAGKAGPADPAPEVGPHSPQSVANRPLRPSVLPPNASVPTEPPPHNRTGGRRHGRT